MTTKVSLIGDVMGNGKRGQKFEFEWQNDTIQENYCLDAQIGFQTSLNRLKVC